MNTWTRPPMTAVDDTYIVIGALATWGCVGSPLAIEP